MAGDLPEEREPVRVAARARPVEAGGEANKRGAAEKLARRLIALPAGRYELIITVGDGGLVDWSVRFFGKVEAP